MRLVPRGQYQRPPISQVKPVVQEILLLEELVVEVAVFVLVLEEFALGCRALGNSIHVVA